MGCLIDFFCELFVALYEEGKIRLSGGTIVNTIMTLLTGGGLIGFFIHVYHETSDTKTAVLCLVLIALTLLGMVWMLRIIYKAKHPNKLSNDKEPKDTTEINNKKE